MHSVETLIADAIEKCGTSAELARRLGVHRSEITDWKNGRRPVSPCSAGLMADVLGLDANEARQLCAEATINCSRPEIRDRLRRALFTLLAVGVALSAPGHSDAQAQATPARSAGLVDSLYIVAHWVRLLFAPLRVTRCARYYVPHGRAGALPTA
jgi:transcriptional regulator with XRE-family HTH domain